MALDDRREVETGGQSPEDAERTEERDPETWHHGLVATWWAEFNDDFRPHEIEYFQRQIARCGEPALDVACGTGRVLIPCLRADLDVDGCDVAADRIEHCRVKAAGEGLAPALFVQAMHEVDPPRMYRTVVVCGAFGLGSTRAQDVEAALRCPRSCRRPGSAVSRPTGPSTRCVGGSSTSIRSSSASRS